MADIPESFGSRLYGPPGSQKRFYGPGSGLSPTSGSFSQAGEQIISSLEQGMVDAAMKIMAESIQECPVSGPETYNTDVRTVDGRKIEIDNSNQVSDLMKNDSGTLRRSARIFAPIRSAVSISITMGYGFGTEVNPQGRIAASYAVPVHEIESATHTTGKSHYLIDPVLSGAGTFEETLSASVDHTYGGAHTSGAEEDVVWSGDEVA